MSGAYDPDQESTNVTARVNDEFLDEFDRALKKAQIEGKVPMDMTRAEAIRQLMAAAIENPSLFAENK
ncbi:hypothetical protein [Halorubrum sp. SP9]|uniref:hypothetical protein n=1 Tax=Halorubrum sp. SP9 TaxID=1537267 RepID=UPI0010F96F2D|nr:hypothetical protein [Halorubrum sp. SP9]TKX70791.1 hypothetical protein EXE45_03150 [Halorubrum sp. SP9]